METAEQTEGHLFDVIFIGMPFVNGEEGGRFYCLIPINEDISVRFNTNNAITVNLDPEDDRDKDWNGVIMKPLPWSPIDKVTAYVTCPWDRESREWKDSRATLGTVVPFQQLTTHANTQQVLNQAKTRGARIRLVTSDKTYTRNLNALKVLNRNLARTFNQKLVVGRRYDKLLKKDIYSAVRERFPEPADLMNLNDQQRAAVMEASAAPEGLVLVAGPPGTGKTHLAIQMCTPFLLDQEKHQILLTSHSNQAVDKLTADMIEHVDRLSKTHPQMRKHMVIRFHSLTSEEDVVVWEANQARDKPEDARPALFQEVTDETKTATLFQMENAYVLWEHYVQHTRQRFAGLNDRRIVLLKSSLGWRLLQVAGIIESAWSESKRFADFRESLRQYRNERKWEKQERIAFREQQKELFSETISKATVVCCSLSNTAETLIRMNFGPDFIILDEAARATEADCWTLWANYPTTMARLLIGDPRQLQPQVETDSSVARLLKQNGFAHQLSMSLMARLEWGGFPTTTLQKQNRAVTSIVDTYNKPFYNGLLTDGPATAIEKRPLYRKMVNYNERVWKKQSPVLFLDVRHGKAEKISSQSSWFNEENVKQGINLIYSLLHADVIPAYRITVVTPYLAQVRIYRLALQNLHRKHSRHNCRDIEVTSIDGYQGKENNVVILDLVVTDTPGFLTEMNRLVVATSRARDGLYIIGSKKGIDNFKRRSGRYIKRYLSTILPFRCAVEDQQIPCDYYTKGDVKFGRDAYQGASNNETDNDQPMGNDQPMEAWGPADGAAPPIEATDPKQPSETAQQTNTAQPTGTTQPIDNAQPTEAWGMVIDTPMADRPAEEWVEQPVGQPAPDHAAW